MSILYISTYLLFCLVQKSIVQYISTSFSCVVQNIYYSVWLNISVVLFHFVASKAYCWQCTDYVYLQFTAHKVKVVVLVTKSYSVDQVMENEFGGGWGGDLTQIRGNRKAWRVFVVKNK